MVIARQVFCISWDAVEGRKTNLWRREGDSTIIYFIPFFMCTL